MTSEIQSVRFDRSMWKYLDALEWCFGHKLAPLKAADVTPHQFRFRIREPALYARFTTKKLGHGISLVLGYFG